MDGRCLRYPHNLAYTYSSLGPKTTGFEVGCCEEIAGFTSSHVRQIMRHRTPIRVALVLLLCLETSLWSCTGIHQDIRSNTLSCPDTIQAKLNATKSTIHVSYTEPSMNLKGDPLTSLAKTSIYYDIGHGRTLAKEVPATQLSGGGEISETITVPAKIQGEQSVRICVTATDSHGNESPSTP